MSVIAQELISQALEEIGVLAGEETAKPGDAAFGLKKLNRILDSWNARKINIFNYDFTEYPLTANLQPHTIGPTGTFVVSSRPIEIPGAALVLTTSTPNVHCPLRIRDKDWWASQRIPGLASSIPSDLYYAPTVPNGSIYLWPKPDTAYKLKLETGTILAAVVLNTIMNLAPGYQDALTYTLALTLCPSFGKTADPLLLAMWQKAMQTIQGPNSKAPRISTRDFGMPSDGPGDFDYRTGSLT